MATPRRFPMPPPSLLATSALPLLAGAALGAVAYRWWAGPPRPRATAAPAAAGSTTSSGHTGSVYETATAVGEYLMFHFGAPEDVLPYPAGPKAALDFASRTAAMCTEWCRREGLPLGGALDVGCAVGRTSFDLSAHFARVVGIDFSAAFVAAANSLKADGSAPYSLTVEGDVRDTHLAQVPRGAHAERITFAVGDACALPETASLGGPFSVIHGANLLCRLPRPTDFLDALPRLLVAGGLVVLVSPYSWLPQYTPRTEWLGERRFGAAGDN